VRLCEFIDVSPHDLKATMLSIGRMTRFLAKGWRNIARSRSRAHNPWLSLAFDSAEMATEAQHVILLRLNKVGKGADDLHQEFRRMTSEKPAAFVNAHLAAAAALAKGKKDHVAAQHALRVYREAVRANLRRLRRKSAS
jgi:hypothetical protein